MSAPLQVSRALHRMQRKQQNGEVNFPEVEEHEADADEIFTALNMAEGLHKTLEEINRKLEKLDTIQITVNDVQASLQKLEGRIQKLECSQTTANRDIENLTESYNKNQRRLRRSSGEN